MTWVNIPIEFFMSEQFRGSEPIDRATWFALNGYCHSQENGGVIRGAASWADRKWQQIAAVTLEEVLRKSDLWSWDEQGNLHLHAYPTEKETEVQHLRSIGKLTTPAKQNAARENGKRGGRPRNQDQNPTENPTQNPTETQQKTHRTERNGTEGNGTEQNTHTPPSSVCVSGTRAHKKPPTKAELAALTQPTTDELDLARFDARALFCQRTQMTWDQVLVLAGRVASEGIHTPESIANAYVSASAQQEFRVYHPNNRGAFVSAISCQSDMAMFYAARASKSPKTYRLVRADGRDINGTVGLLPSQKPRELTDADLEDIDGFLNTTK